MPGDNARITSYMIELWNQPQLNGLTELILIIDLLNFCTPVYIAIP